METLGEKTLQVLLAFTAMRLEFHSGLPFLNLNPQKGNDCPTSQNFSKICCQRFPNKSNHLSRASRLDFIYWLRPEHEIGVFCAQPLHAAIRNRSLYQMRTNSALFQITTEYWWLTCRLSRFNEYCSQMPVSHLGH